MIVVLENARCIYTCDTPGLIEGGYVIIDGARIREIGHGDAPHIEGADKIDCTGCIVLPGFINVHHHFFQSVTRAVPGLHRADSAAWLSAHYPLWAEIEPDDLTAAVRNSSAELLLSGATTSADHSFVLGGVGAELAPIEIAAVREMGLRLHLARSCLPVIEGAVGAHLQRTMGERINRLIAPEDEVIEQCRADVERWHDASPGAMVRLALGPSNVAYTKPALMKQFGDIAAETGCGLHAHYHPREAERALCRQTQGCEPIEFLDRAGWLGPQTWLAHCTELDDTEIATFGARGVGVAHCPRTVLRLGYQIPRIAAMRAAGVRVSFGVDGAASNDGGSFINELRLGLLLHRARERNPVSEDVWLTPHDALLMATRDAAAMLGRDDIGRLKPGLCADITVFDLSGAEFGGALNDPLGGFLMAGVGARANTTIINGRVVVRNGQITTANELKIAEATSRASAALAERAKAAAIG
ncbi:MAG: amidohydrolase family protein [Pseudolabrys sp.]|nr:amidohydrolase family protein [Pseudolabrys sp.]